MKIILTDHLKFQLYDRKLDLEKIRLTIIKPSLSKPAKDDSLKYQRMFEGRTLCVVGKHVSHNTFIVFTAYYLKQL